MKTLTLLLIMAAAAVAATAQSPETLSMKVGQQKTAVHSRLKIRFVGVTEDSRCPARSVCVWAGNAKVKFEVTGRGSGAQAFNANTNVGAGGGTYSSWSVYLEWLTPAPAAGETLDPKNYEARFTITGLRR